MFIRTHTGEGLSRSTLGAGTVDSTASAHRQVPGWERGGSPGAITRVDLPLRVTDRYLHALSVLLQFFEGRNSFADAVVVRVVFEPRGRLEPHELARFVVDQ